MKNADLHLGFTLRSIREAFSTSDYTADIRMTDVRGPERAGGAGGNLGPGRGITHAPLAQLQSRLVGSLNKACDNCFDVTVSFVVMDCRGGEGLLNRRKS